MKKFYEVPEALIIEFTDEDLLKLSPGDEGDPQEEDW